MGGGWLGGGWQGGGWQGGGWQGGGWQGGGWMSGGGEGMYAMRRRQAAGGGDLTGRQRNAQVSQSLLGQRPVFAHVPARFLHRHRRRKDLG